MCSVQHKLEENFDNNNDDREIGNLQMIEINLHISEIVVVKNISVWCERMFSPSSILIFLRDYFMKLSKVFSLADFNSFNVND